jgi:pilus assembly protein CpaD
METFNMRRIASCALLALALAGCGPINRGVESLHQPVVTRTDYVMDLALASGAGLASGEAARLDGWFQGLGLTYGDRISIDGGQVFGAYDARADIAAVTARYGLLLAEGAPVTTTTPQPGSVRVVVSRSKAEVYGCPNWDRHSQPEVAASTMSNYGCADATNLAAMVANPEDLIRGQVAESGGDAADSLKSVKVYRDRVPTGVGDVKAEKTGGK